MTPEGKIKAAVKEALAEFDIRNAKDAGTFDSADGWFYMPSSSGFGVSGIPDFVGHYLKRFFAVETKAPGKESTGFQLLQLKSIIASGGDVFVIDSMAGVAAFREWLLRISLGV